tara:strand:+ start:85 stop:753 length:669 start_codon:yes stop_codon:yes gene_type:complete
MSIATSILTITVSRKVLQQFTRLFNEMKLYLGIRMINPHYEGQLMTRLSKNAKRKRSRHKAPEDVIKGWAQQVSALARKGHMEATFRIIEDIRCKEEKQLWKAFLDSSLLQNSLGILAGMKAKKGEFYFIEFVYSAKLALGVEAELVLRRSIESVIGNVNQLNEENEINAYYMRDHSLWGLVSFFEFLRGKYDEDRRVHIVNKIHYRMLPDQRQQKYSTEKT